MGRKRLTDSTGTGRQGEGETEARGLTSRLALVSRVSDPPTSGGTDLLQRGTDTIYLVLERLKQIMALLPHRSILRTCPRASRGPFVSPWPPRS